MTMPRNRIRELRYVQASTLIPNPANWRKHPKAQREALQAMLDRVGWADAVIARETPEGLVLVDGHLRADLDANAEVPVLVVDLDEAEAGQVLATLDPLAAMAEANTEALSKLLQEVTVPIDLGDLFPNLPGLLPELPPAPDDVVEPVAEPITKRGDIWQLGRHRLMCGDSTSAEDVARLLDGAKPRLMVTDPPYGVEYDPTWRRDRLKAKVHTDYMPPEQDTKLSFEDAYALSPADVFYIWQGYVGLVATANGLEGLRYQLRCLIVWVKANAVINRGPYANGAEFCWYAVRKGTSGRWIGPPSVNLVWEAGLEQGTDHAAQKPVSLMERPMMYHEGDVYDPFVGSGTTIIAAERQNLCDGDRPRLRGRRGEALGDVHGGEGGERWQLSLTNLPLQEERYFSRRSPRARLALRLWSLLAWPGRR